MSLSRSFSLIAPAALLLLSACSSVVKGVVYLDTNGNLHQDENEQGLPGILLAVTQNSEVLGQTVSEGEGEFNYKIKKPKTDQEICVEASRMSISSFAVAPTTPPAGGPLMAQVVEGEETEEGTEEGEEEETPATQPAPTTPTNRRLTQAAGTLKACKTGAGELGVDLAIAPEYQGIVSRMVVPTLRRLAVGEIATASICYPSRCALDPVVLPAGLELIPGIHSFNPATRQVVIRATQQIPPTSVGLPGGEVTCEPVQLRASEEATEELEIQPEAVCPNNEAMPLPIHTFEVIRVPDVTVTQTMMGEIGLGQTIVVEATARNDGETNLPGAKLVMTLPQFVTGVAVPVGCNNLGQKVECPFDLARSGGSQVRQVIFTLPAAINQDTTFTVATNLVHSALADGSVAAESISFSIQGPPEEEDEEE